MQPRHWLVHHYYDYTGPNITNYNSYQTYQKKGGRLGSYCNLGVENVHSGGGAAEKIPA
jgi:hypothetical protein